MGRNWVLKKSGVTEIGGIQGVLIDYSYEINSKQISCSLCFVEVNRKLVRFEFVAIDDDLSDIVNQVILSVKFR